MIDKVPKIDLKHEIRYTIVKRSRKKILKLHCIALLYPILVKKKNGRNLLKLYCTPLLKSYKY